MFWSWDQHITGIDAFVPAHVHITLLGRWRCMCASNLLCAEL